MTITQMAAGLAEWARPIGFGYRVESDSVVVLADGGGETRWYVRSHSDRILIETAQRGETPYPMMATGSLSDAERYLTYSLGRSMRSVLFSRTRRIRLPIDLASVSRDFAVVPVVDAELSAVVFESGIERARFRRISPPSEAVQFTFYANVPLVDLRRSLLDESGMPALAKYVSAWRSS